MRRTTSTWTAAILGAALTAPAVSAQQSPTAATATGSNQVAEADPSFGMAAARGARNLLRNGLDYIDYQEFDRALKYLREAEKRQNELNEPEKTKLKEGIERAQRGMREAIGSETPYALSERSPRSGGGGSTTAQVASSARGFAAARPQAKPARESEGDDRGEPIQLTGGESVAPPLSRRDDAFPTEPASLPEIPDPPSLPRIEVSPALADAPLELTDDVEMPTPPPVNRITAAPLSAKTPELTAAPAPEPSATPDLGAMPEADLLAPLPDFDRLDVTPPSLGPIAPREDAAVQLSNTEPAPSQAAPAPILLENPNDGDQVGAASTPDPAAAPAAEIGSFDLPPLGGGSAEAVASEPAAMEMSPTQAPIATPEAPAPRVSDADLDLPALPADLGGPSPDPTVQPPADEPASEPEPRPEIAPEPLSEPETDAMPQPAAIADEPEELPELPGATDDDAPRMAVSPTAEPAAPAADAMDLDDELPELPDEATPTPAPAATLDVEELPEPAPAAAPAPAPAPADDLSASLAPRRRGASSLPPELQRRVEEVAQRMEAEAAQSQSAAQPAPTDFDADQRNDLDEMRTETQIDISRAPSPAEARPIAAIPVPEDWVPLGAREWSPQRKYWAAAATCHMPLYFQDPMLERYGHSVEKFIGPAGRFFAYPVDNHTQTTQRNQMAQPFASAGLFAFQILTLPYALIMDPPWESQYDLGYWRPGDKIPTDLYYLPTHGTGPALKGRKY